MLRGVSWFEWLYMSRAPVCATKQDVEEMGDRILGALDDTLNTVSDRLTKAQGEITALIEKLTDEATSGGVSDDTIARLEAVASSLDDIVPDVVEGPVEGGTVPDEGAAPE